MAEVIAERLPDMLRASDAERDAACQELRDLLVRAALAYLLRQGYPPSAFGADRYESIAEDFAQDALVIILRELDSFRGQSRFTTWAYRIVINLMADEVRRRTWRRRPLDQEFLSSPRLMSREPDPAESAGRHDFLRIVNEIIADELTPRQRQALLGRIVDEKPLIVMADELGTTKDNVYKLLHDARRNLKRALAARGLNEADVLGAFSRTGT